MYCWVYPYVHVHMISIVTVLGATWIYHLAIPVWRGAAENDDNVYYNAIKALVAERDTSKQC